LKAEERSEAELKKRCQKFDDANELGTNPVKKPTSSFISFLCFAFSVLLSSSSGEEVKFEPLQADEH
jgi:hypothetical protein